MTKYEIKKYIDDYLKKYNINNRLINDHKKPMLSKDLDTFVITYKVDAPGGLVESDIHIYKDRLQVRAYYLEAVSDLCKENNCYEELLKVINFINANVFFDSLYTPRLYLSTDGYHDIVITTVILYDFFELAPIETMEFITCYCPEYLEKFAIPIYAVVSQKISADNAIEWIKQNVSY
ncbi:MAG: hypothetical protein IJA08_03125 [Clostridia bacterium]|nr:hypothetical protein [Clostridia bacterium]